MGVTRAQYHDLKREYYLALTNEDLICIELKLMDMLEYNWELLEGVS